MNSIQENGWYIGRDYRKLTPGDISRIKDENELCMVCGRYDAMRAVDHCHKWVHSYWTRGVLCRPCNRTLERVLFYGMDPVTALAAAGEYRPRDWEPPIKWRYLIYHLRCKPCEKQYVRVCVPGCRGCAEDREKDVA